MKVVVSGTFDCFHHGHAELLDTAGKIAGLDEVIVFVNSDDSLKYRKEVREPQHERVNNVDAFFLYREVERKHYKVAVKKPSDLVSYFEVERNHCFFLHGDDWDIHKLSEHYGVSLKFWRHNNITLLFKPRTPDISSTSIRESYGKK